MVGSFYPINGIREGRGSNGEIPVRMEIDDWYLSKEKTHLNQHTLAFTALNKMYQMSPHDKLSYYQIAGIHNQPIVPWDDALFENKNYCMHSSPNFPTWHRPYNVLLEQRLHEVMIREIIPTFPESDRADLIEAANNFRLPFWDWACKKPGENGEYNYDVPKLVRIHEVEVRVPGGTSKIKNPFWQFSMPDGMSMGDPQLRANAITREPYNRTKGTSRHAYEDDAKEDFTYLVDGHIKGVQNNDGVKEDLQAWKWEAGGNLTGTLRDWFYRVLLISPFESFATKKADIGGLSGKYSSLEDIHDVVHNWGGGSYGHMAAPAVGAFDPLFWLHHNNVDRMFDLWVALHPKEAKEWVEKDSDAQINLVPFRQNAYGDYHNARSCWDTESFGYTYPETQRWQEKYKTDGKFDEDKLQVELAEYLNNKYNSSASAAKKAILTTTKESPSDKTISHPEAAANTEAPSISAQIGGQEVKGVVISALSEGQKAADLIPDVLQQEDYVANVIYEKYALGGHPFTIRFFIGAVPDGHKSVVSQATTQVGEIYNFSDPVEMDKPGCENCKKNMVDQLKTTGQVPLTNALLTRFKQHIVHETDDGDHVVLKSMAPEDVVPFLKHTFHWRVTDHEGYVIDKTRISSLKVSVAVGNASHFADKTKLSNFSDYKILYDITADAASGTGAKPEDNLFHKNEGLTGLLGNLVSALA